MKLLRSLVLLSAALVFSVGAFACGGDGKEEDKRTTEIIRTVS